MSLNRSERLVSDYIEQHPEEKRFWVEKVQAVAAAEADDHAAAARLADELSSYFEERSAVVPHFRAEAGAGGIRAASLRNLAEYWVRVWMPPRRRPAKNPGGNISGEF